MNYETPTAAAPEPGTVAPDAVLPPPAPEGCQDAPPAPEAPDAAPADAPAEPVEATNP